MCLRTYMQKSEVDTIVSSITLRIFIIIIGSCSGSVLVVLV